MKRLSEEVLESLGFEIIKGNSHIWDVEVMGDFFYVTKSVGQETFTVEFRSYDDTLYFEGYEYKHQIESLLSALNPQSNKR